MDDYDFLDTFHREYDAKHPPLTAGKLIELLSMVDPSLPVFTHANNHSADDHMMVAVQHNPWFRVHSGKDFAKPPTMGVRIGNFKPSKGDILLFDFYAGSSQGERDE